MTTVGSAEPIYQSSDDGFYHIVYKTTNILNGFIYIGIHSTRNLNDGYLGSGNALKRAIKKDGIQNFRREILFIMNSREQILLKEAELVDTVFLRRSDVYNKSPGGLVHLPNKMVCVKDLIGNRLYVDVNDPRYIFGELKYVHTGMINVKDSQGNTLKVEKDDPRYLSGELKHIYSGMVNVKDGDGKRYKVSKTDPRYISGELIPLMRGTKMLPRKISKLREETKQKISDAVSRSLRNYRWIFNPITGKRTRIKKSDPIPDGWKPGRKMAEDNGVKP